MKKFICPVCNREYYGTPALSRKDNKTEICSSCGMREAIGDLFKFSEKGETENDDTPDSRRSRIESTDNP